LLLSFGIKADKSIAYFALAKQKSSLAIVFSDAYKTSVKGQIKPDNAVKIFSISIFSLMYNS
jgi:hypothetical protein